METRATGVARVIENKIIYSVLFLYKITSVYTPFLTMILGSI